MRVLLVWWCVASVGVRLLFGAAKSGVVSVYVCIAKVGR